MSQFRFHRLRMPNSYMNKDEDEVGCAAVAVFDQALGVTDPVARPVPLCGCHHACEEDATVPHCRRHRTRSNYHEHPRRAFLRERDNQIIMLRGACIGRNGMIVARLQDEAACKPDTTNSSCCPAPVFVATVRGPPKFPFHLNTLFFSSTVRASQTPL
ncbi:hypothetical protein HPB52_015364 [Rhipicephalus sanguineus]|uniref:Uncharacterized protein n=1 Tax=Rhipicephalus sanguineus TaxID=34632 RepID=A0A9D4PCL4_RHISA|nr:hypothetical protein HPB52_015364 [Rhipicephalus sanguineus]